MKATAKSRRALGGPGNRQESAERAAWRARVDVTLLATLRDGLLRRSEAAALTWGDVEFQRRRRCPRSLAGKPLAGFRATPSRRNPVLYGMVVYAIRFKNPLLHRQSTLRKRRLGENRVSGQTSSNPAPVQDRPGSGGHGTLRWQGNGPGPAGHQARARAAGPWGISLRNDYTAYRQPGQGGNDKRPASAKGLHRHIPAAWEWPRIL